jgi:putative alpha-1,2-mannosidase
VTAPGTSDSRRYIQSAQTDEVIYGRTYLTTDALLGIRSLAFTVGEEPSGWGYGTGCRPTCPQLIP